MARGVISLSAKVKLVRFMTASLSAVCFTTVNWTSLVYRYPTFMASGQVAQCGWRTKRNWTKTAYHTLSHICTGTPLYSLGLGTGPTEGLSS